MDLAIPQHWYFISNTSRCAHRLESVRYPRVATVRTSGYCTSLPRLEELREQERESAFFTEMPAPHVFEIANIILGRMLLLFSNSFSSYFLLCFCFPSFYFLEVAVQILRLPPDTSDLLYIITSSNCRTGSWWLCHAQ